MSTHLPTFTRGEARSRGVRMTRTVNSECLVGPTRPWVHKQRLPRKEAQPPHDSRACGSRWMARSNIDGRHPRVQGPGGRRSIIMGQFRGATSGGCLNKSSVHLPQPITRNGVLQSFVGTRLLENKHSGRSDKNIEPCRGLRRCVQGGQAECHLGDAWTAGRLKLGRLDLCRSWKRGLFSRHLRDKGHAMQLFPKLLTFALWRSLSRERFRTA